MTKTILHQIDAFTSEPFRGNPAAVCVLEPGDARAADEKWMQSLALEMNLSETAYVVRREPGRYGLRWFTPLSEAQLCGHATLASAHALWTLGHESAEEIRFDSRGGTLAARRERDGWIRLDFPLLPQSSVPTPAGLERALGARPLYVGENAGGRLLAELASEAELRALDPDLSALRALGRDVAVTARATTPGFDFISRYFSPMDGIGEDPVTGSAHCLLGPFWAERLGRTELTAFQASRRGGVVRVAVDSKNQRVALFGQAVTVAKIEVL